jgi:LemA protein
LISESIVWWALAATLFFWSVGAYNRLMRLRSHASRAFAALANGLQRYTELVAACGPAHPAHSSAWSGLYGAQAQFSASLAIARTRPLDASVVDALAAADHVLHMAWQRLLDSEPSPDRPPVPETCRQQWRETSQQIHHTGLAFAQAVHDYNHAITQFPALVLALLFGFRTAKPLTSAVPPPSASIPL